MCAGPDSTKSFPETFLIISGQVNLNGRTLTLDGSGAGVLSGAISGAGTVVKQGSGQWQQLAGTIDGTLDIQQGTFSPGISGTLTAGTASFASGTTFQVHLAANGNSELIATGSVDLSRTPNLDVRLDGSFKPQAGQDFVIVASAGGLTGPFSDSTGRILQDGDIVTAADGSTFVIRYVPSSPARGSSRAPGDPAGRVVLCAAPADTKAFVSLAGSSNEFAFGLAIALSVSVEVCPDAAATLESSSARADLLVSGTAPTGGSVALYLDDSATAADTQPLVNGVATFQLSGFASGAHHVRAQYLTADPKYQLSPLSDPESFTVDPPVPIAAGDAYSTPAGQALTVASPGVLRNDSSPSGGQLTAILVSGPQHGSLGSGGLHKDGSFAYTPDVGFMGTDSFTYKVNDGLADSSVATVTITVGPPPPPPEGQLDGVITPAGVVLFAVRGDHSVYEHDVSGWHPVGLNFIESMSATAGASGNPVVFATTQGHDLFLFDPTKGLTNTGLRFIQALSATTDASGNPIIFAVTDAHDLFEYGPTVGLVPTGLKFIDQISAAIDSAGNPIVFAITQGHDLFSFGATLGLHNLQSRFLTAITAVQDQTTHQAVLYATTQGHDLFYFDGAWHNLNSRFIQQISAGTGNAGQPVVYAITQAGDLARFDSQRGWFLPKPPKSLAEVHGLMNDGVMGRSADGSMLEYSPTTGWLDLGTPG